MNIAHYLIEQAQARPSAPAIILVEKGSGQVHDSQQCNARAQLTFKQLDDDSSLLAAGLAACGIGRGCRTVLMVRPGLEFFSLAFALFKAGAVPVMIDPGMGRDRLLECVRDVEPEALIGVPKAHLARVLFPRYFRSMKRFVTVGRRWFWGGKTLDGIREMGRAADNFQAADTRDDETAAILFTSGATGPAKGAVYTHGIFDAQTRWLKNYFRIEPGEIDLPAFPLFALFSCAMGMTCVIPDMDPTRPAEVDAARFAETILRYGCTNSFGSPAIWNRVSRYCAECGLRLPSLRRIMMAGAPVSPDLIERTLNILGPEGDCFTPYGATEALPVACVSGREILAGAAARSRQGAGICVGRPVDGIELRIIRITDDPIGQWDESLVLPQGEIGEIAVKGAVVTREYFNRPDDTRMAKIAEGAIAKKAIGLVGLVGPVGRVGPAGAKESGGCVWHRMGDVGYLDEQSRLWFCGRKAHRVAGGDGKVWYSICCEAIFNQHPDVARSALAGAGPKGAQRPVIFIEPIAGKMPRSDSDRARFIAELRRLADASPLTRDIEEYRFHPSFPVDVRHNAKISRERLTQILNAAPKSQVL
ncbi:MAG: fatty acid CoA ligase family protein [Candidatus Sumerlaeota bacterium]|nr:fatty acid CoA ligase family protein [Candidatus Sumerlaeota bacterium]